MTQKTDKEVRQARKEKLLQKTPEALAAMVIRLEDELQRSKAECEREARDRRKLEDQMEAKEARIELQDRMIELRGLNPVRLMVEYYKEQVNQPEGEYSGLKETEVEPVGVVCETVAALTWEVYSDNHSCCGSSGYHLRGVDSNYNEFDFPDVVSYTTPDGQQHILEGKDEE